MTGEKLQKEWTEEEIEALICLGYPFPEKEAGTQDTPLLSYGEYRKLVAYLERRPTLALLKGYYLQKDHASDWEMKNVTLDRLRSLVKRESFASELMRVGKGFLTWIDDDFYPPLLQNRKDRDVPLFIKYQGHNELALLKSFLVLEDGFEEALRSFAEANSKKASHEHLPQGEKTSSEGGEAGRDKTKPFPIEELDEATKKVRGLDMALDDSSLSIAQNAIASRMEEDSVQSNQEAVAGEGDSSEGTGSKNESSDQTMEAVAEENGCNESRESKGQEGEEANTGAGAEEETAIEAGAESEAEKDGDSGGIFFMDDSTSIYNDPERQMRLIAHSKEVDAVISGILVNFKKQKDFIRRVYDMRHKIVMYSFVPEEEYMNDEEARMWMRRHSFTVVEVPEAKIADPAKASRERMRSLFLRLVHIAVANNLLVLADGKTPMDDEFVANLKKALQSSNSIVWFEKDRDDVQGIDAELQGFQHGFFDFANLDLVSMRDNANPEAEDVVSRKSKFF